MTASAAISNMHMMVRRPTRFIPRQLRSPDTRTRRLRDRFLKPFLGGVLVRKDLQVVDIADFLAGVDVD
jgi:hypothetical protein